MADGTDGWRIKAAYNEMQDGFDIAIFKGNAICTSFNFAAYTPGEKVYPTLEAGPESKEFLRAALSAAWNAGFRPEGFNDTRESMKATNAHLQDMRAIAFHKIGAAKP
jgi:hypothetical protein